MITRELDAWGQGGEELALRLRALVLLLWEGSLRTRAAIALDVSDVVEGEGKLSIRREVCLAEAEKPPHRFVLSQRARVALLSYLRHRRERVGELNGPLFVGIGPRGKGRLSQRSAVHSWHQFFADRLPDLADRYQLDDVVFSGRMAWLRAAEGDTDLLAVHAGISPEWAARYARYLPHGRRTARAIARQLDKQRR